MLCSQCEKLVDLDSFIPIRASNDSYDDSKKVSHHGSYQALYQAAQSGCELCQHISQKYCGGLVPELDNSPDPRFRITFEVFEDSLVFHIPMRIQYGEDDFDVGEDSVKVYVSTDENDPLSKLFNKRPLSDDSSSDGCFVAASKWLNICLDKHSECPKESSPLPSRVVNVGSTKDAPYLYVSHGEAATWLALSHCWGQEQTFTTTAETLATRCEGLPMHALPATYQDAILITRRLGFRYLWIDSLCIIQNSKEDWEAEAQKMASIYQNALITISADASEDDHKGIFNAVRSRRVKSDSFVLRCHSLKMSISGSIIIDCQNAKPKGKDRHWVADAMPLQTRAWVLQEKALSVRKLHYNSNELTWACAMMGSSEQNPKIAQRNLSTIALHSIPFAVLPPRINFSDRNGQHGHPKSITGALGWWYSQLNDYMKRDLTFKKDRFPAISGLAREFSRRTSYRYAAGIWLEDFQRGLLWRGAASREYSTFSPSWSWAFGDFNEWAGGPHDTGAFMEHGSSHGAEFIEMSSPSTADKFLIPGMPMKLTLRGWCKDIIDLRNAGRFYSCPSTWALFDLPEPRGPRYLQFRSLPPNSKQLDEETVLFWPDYPLDAALAQATFEDQAAIVLRISDFSTWDPGNRHNAVSSAWALLLIPSDSDHGSYQRTGLVRIPTLNPISDIKGFDIKTISIV